MAGIGGARWRAGLRPVSAAVDAVAFRPLESVYPLGTYLADGFSDTYEAPAQEIWRATPCNSGTGFISSRSVEILGPLDVARAPPARCRLAYPR